MQDAGDMGSIPGSGRCPGEGKEDPHQYSRLKNSKEPGGQQSRGCRELDPTEATEHTSALRKQAHISRLE